MRAEALGDTVLVGHSMGGAVALEALLLLPGEKVSAAAVRDMARSDPAIGRALFENLLRWDVDAVLARVGRKVPLIYSQDLVDAESVRRWSGIARLMPVPSSSHFPMLDAPHELDDALLEAARVG